MPGSPTTSRFPFLDHPAPLAIAHRGGAGDLPGNGPQIENTMPAFEHAVSLGYRWIETDVHATADGVLVAFHDDTLDRVTDRHGRIGALTWSEVRRARVGGREPIPLLEELLGAWPDVFVNIDPKADSAVGPLVAVLRRAGATERVCIGSFSDARIERVRRALGSRLCTSTGPREVARLRAASLVPGPSTGGRYRAACVQVPASARGRALVDERFVATAHRCGLPVHVWTVDEAAEMTRLLDLGVDGIMTDRPGILRDVLVGRAQWPT